MHKLPKVRSHRDPSGILWRSLQLSTFCAIGFVLVMVLAGCQGSREVPESRSDDTASLETAPSQSNKVAAQRALVTRTLCAANEVERMNQKLDALLQRLDRLESKIGSSYGSDTVSRRLDRLEERVGSSHSSGSLESLWRRVDKLEEKLGTSPHSPSWITLSERLDRLELTVRSMK